MARTTINLLGGRGSGNSPGRLAIGGIAIAVVAIVAGWGYIGPTESARVAVVDKHQSVDYDPDDGTRDTRREIVTEGGRYSVDRDTFSELIVGSTYDCKLRKKILWMRPGDSDLTDCVIVSPSATG